jgi:hypothetical protein
LTAFIAIILADFISGLVHLYIDYQPLNYKKGYEELFFYTGARHLEEYALKKQAAMKNSSVFDLTVYHFKMHHSYPLPFTLRPYRYFFYDTCVPTTLLIIWAIILSTVLQGVTQLKPFSPLLTHLSFMWLIVALLLLHTNHIHACVHGSKTMTWGVAAVRFLQKYHLIYSTKTHKSHHATGETGFCFITGYTNFIVNKICQLLLRWHIIKAKHWHGER